MSQPAQALTILEDDSEAFANLIKQKIAKLIPIALNM